MREALLREFFDGQISAKALAEDLSGRQVGNDQVYRYPIMDMAESFEVKPTHLVRICEAFLTGDLSAENLRMIGFSLLSSEHFEWAEEGAELSSRVASEWAAPEINYPIVRENVEKWCHILEGGEDLLSATGGGG